MLKQAESGIIVVTNPDTSTFETTVYDKLKYKYSDKCQNLNDIIPANITMKAQEDFGFDGWETDYDGNTYFGFIPGGANSTLIYNDVWYSLDEQTGYYNIQYYLQSGNLVNGKFELNNNYVEYGQPIRSRRQKVGTVINVESPVQWAEINT